MTKYHYKIKNVDGEIEEGEAIAEDRFSLANDIRNLGKTIITIEKMEEKKGMFSKSSSIVLFRRVKLHDKILFIRNLGSMIGSGLPLSRALTVLERQTKKEGFKQVIQKILTGITKGDALSDSFEKHPKVFSSLEIAMVRVGEESGNLAESLDSIAIQLEKSYNLRKKVKSAMMYPSIIMGVMTIIGGLMFVFVVPALTATFEDLDTELPQSTQLIITMSNILKEHSILVVIGLILFGIGLRMFGKTKVGKRTFDFISLNIPVISLMVKEYNTAQTTRTLASLLSSGVGMVQTITITQQVVQNSYYKDVLSTSIEDVQKGVPLSESFVKNEKLYPIVAGELIQVGEETGQLSDMLQKVASYYENEVETKTKDLSTIIEPFLMVIIGTAVGFFALAMITPMYSVMNTL
ncbi:MAG: type II secretion system F family protein [Candidatus Pacebacteria bacterium]|nr:type II secretion system F family protein [Candidatus Paceibacterota bacterium]